MGVICLETYFESFNENPRQLLMHMIVKVAKEAPSQTLDFFIQSAALINIEFNLC